MNLKEYYKELLSEQLLNEIGAAKLGRIEKSIKRKEAQKDKTTAAIDSSRGRIQDALLNPDAVKTAAVGPGSPLQQKLNTLYMARARGQVGRKEKLGKRGMKIAGQAGMAIGQGAKNRDTIQSYSDRIGGLGHPGGHPRFKPR